jgi:hypothetical protein
MVWYRMWTHVIESRMDATVASVAARMNMEASFRPASVASGMRLGEMRLWWLTAAALLLVLIAPFALVDVPPILDYPNHLARYYVLAHPDDPLLSQMYAPNWRILPNLGLDLIGAALLRVTDVYIGGRILLALSLVAPVIGAVIYHRAVFGRASLWPLASGLIAYNGVFFLGFMNCLLAIGVALGAAGGWIVFGRRNMTKTQIVFGGLAAAVTFVCHIFGSAFFALLIGSFEVEGLWRRRRSDGLAFAAGMAATRIAVALSPAVLLYSLCPLNAATAPLGLWLWNEKLWRLLAPFMTYNAGLTVLTAVAMVSALMLLRRQFRSVPGLPLVLAVLAIFYVAVPEIMSTGALIDVRFSTMACLLLFAGLEPNLTGRQARLVMVTLGALIVVRSAYVGSTWLDHRKDLAELRAAIASIAPGTRVLASRSYPDEPVYASSPERLLPRLYPTDSHLPALLLIERHAFWPLLFAHPAQQPIRVLPPYDKLSYAAGMPVKWQWLSDRSYSNVQLSAAPYLPGWRSNFDVVLLIDPPASLPPIAGLSVAYRGDYVQLYRIEHELPALSSLRGEQQ